jgi:hypothetical protein
LEKIALNDIGHVLRRHNVSVKITMTVVAEKAAKGDLCDKVATVRALLTCVVLVQTNHNVAE